MASTAQIVEDILVEIGKRGTAVRRKVETAVNDTVVDMLQQNDGRFRGLAKTQTINVLADTVEYKLNADFNTAKDTFAEYDSDDEFVARVFVLTKSEIHNRLAEGAPVHRLMSYIEFYESHTNGRGNYLILSQDPTTTHIYKFDYYREPTPEDTDIIRKTAILKHGIRGRLPDYYEQAEYESAIYLRMLQGFRESAERFVTDMIITPPARIGANNDLSHKVGSGG
jgi:hypothetical protein